jgi:hypothetical protein
MQLTRHLPMLEDSSCQKNMVMLKKWYHLNPAIQVTTLINGLRTDTDHSSLPCIGNM